MKNFQKASDAFQKITKKEYGEFLGKAMFKTFFHSSEWHEFLEKEFKWLKFEYYLYKDEAFLPFARFKVFGKEKLISLPFCEYGGPLPLKQGIDFKEFEKDVLEEFKNIKIKFHPKIKSGDSNSDVSTHWIENLKDTSEQELLASFRKTLRHEIKNAQERDLEIKKCPASPASQQGGPAGGSNEQELKQFYNLYVANLRRKKTILYPWSLIQFLYKNPSSELLLAFYKGKVVAGDLFLNYNGFTHYFLSASDYKYRDFSTSHLLLWEKIKTLIGKDVIFDLGATPKGSSLNIFKSGWGGKEYPILQIGIKRSEEFLRSSKTIRNIFGLLPNFAIKILSRYLIKYRI